MVAIVDRWGRPIQQETLDESQTSRVAHLAQQFASHPSRGLTPSKLASILEEAERGNLMSQCDLFEDMEEKDAHIFAEMQKRKLALQTVSWDIAPPENASAAEKNAAQAVKEMIQAIPDFEDVLFDLLDAIGKGYSCQEIEWQRLGKSWLPKEVHWRPPSWFQVNQTDQNELRLRDNTAFGAELQAFGWIVHKHRGKSGYLARAGLHRVLAWPYLFKNYSVRDLAEFLEIYGLPVRIGKYPSGASDKEKATLLRAVVSIGHNAAGIIPSGMEMELLEAAKGTHDPFQAMMDWAERSESKAILGQTLSAEAKATGLGSGTADVHDEVRHDILVSDARQAAATLTRDLVYPIAALNVAGIDPQRAPRLVFDTQEAEDLKLYSEAVPALVDVGLCIPSKWAHEKLRIPEPQNDEEVLARKPGASSFVTLKGMTAGAVAAAAELPIPDDQVDRLDQEAGPVLDAMIGQIRRVVNEATSLEDLRDQLIEIFPQMDAAEFGRVMQRALLAAELAGRFDIMGKLR